VFASGYLDGMGVLPESDHGTDMQNLNIDSFRERSSFQLPPRKSSQDVSGTEGKAGRLCGRGEVRSTGGGLTTEIGYNGLSQIQSPKPAKTGTARSARRLRLVGKARVPD